MEQIRCNCERESIIAEKDDEAVYVQCRSCKEKTAIPIKETE